VNRRATTLISPDLFPGLHVRVFARAVTGDTWRVATYVDAGLHCDNTTDECGRLEGDAPQWQTITTNMRTGAWPRDSAMVVFDRLVASYQAACWEITESREWNEPGKAAGRSNPLKGASQVIHTNGVAETARAGMRLVDTSSREWQVDEKDGEAVLRLVRDGQPDTEHSPIRQVEREYNDGVFLTVVDPGDAEEATG
jgi:hypothetical protein